MRIVYIYLLYIRMERGTVTCYIVGGLYQSLEIWIP